MVLSMSKRALMPVETAQEKLKGRISRVVFHNSTNGYCVLNIETPDAVFEESITAVGYMPSIRTGDEYEFTGAWKTHPKFGQQFAFAEHQMLMPSTREGLISYLCSVGTGIGQVKAARIVDALGEDCLDKIQASPEVLFAVPGIKPEQAEEISKALNENRVLAELTSLICRQGITPRLASKIFAKYGADSINVVKENPYILAEEVWGIGFVTADKVARAVGIEPDNPYRIQAAVEYLLKEAGNDGHCYLLPSEIMARLPQALGKGHGILAPQVGEAVAKLIEKDRVVREGDFIYSRKLYEAECELAGRMRALVAGHQIETEGAEDLVEELEHFMGIRYAEKQREAIVMALRSPFSIITGGPGTGKTTVTRGLVEAYKELYSWRNIFLASPTGRAAKRLSEATGREAKTIHRLLRYSPIDGYFEYHELNPLPGPGLLIVDEFSMCDIELARDLFRAIPRNMQVVLVGDLDQLPSVGPGSVLRDSILSAVIPTTKLEFVYRQAEGSGIAYLAHQVRDGILPDLNNLPADVEVIICPDQEMVPEVVVKESLKAAESYTSMGFQVLAPMRKGVAGVNNLNEAVREAINPAGAGAEEIRLGGTVYRLGDKVMVVKNDYHKGVFNGDLGKVTEIVKQGEEGPGIWVYFDGFFEPVFFGIDDAEEIVLAYCGTVHKAQGSEFPVVIAVFTRGHYIMLQRNLFYTAVTRAKSRLVLVCQPDAVELAVKNDKIAERNSRLKERLQAAV